MLRLFTPSYLQLLSMNMKVGQLRRLIGNTFIHLKLGLEESSTDTVGQQKDEEVVPKQIKLEHHQRQK